MLLNEQNKNILPLNLNKGKRILVTGPNSNNHSVLGDWVFAQPEENVITVYEGIKSIGESKGFKIDFFDSNEDIRSISEKDIIRPRQPIWNNVASFVPASLISSLG